MVLVGDAAEVVEAAVVTVDEVPGLAAWLEVKTVELAALEPVVKVMLKLNPTVGKGPSTGKKHTRSYSLIHASF